jgi:hypothetical protein
MNGLAYFDESGTMGTILILIVSVIYAAVLTRRDPALGARSVLSSPTSSGPAECSVRRFFSSIGT